VENLNKRPFRLHKRNWIDDNEKVAVAYPLGDIYWLNETGALIWKLCDGTHSIKDMASVLTEKYNVDMSTAVKDVLEITASLEKFGLVAWQ
jgi:hypothetical protein